MDAYDELYAYSMGRKHFILQHVVDAHMAQRARAVNPPPIGAIFALAGLYLHVEKGFSGTAVQSAHRIMGNRKRRWPDIVWPVERGCVTAETVLAVEAGPARDEAIDGWCASVWSTFRPGNRNTIVTLLAEYGIG